MNSNSNNHWVWFLIKRVIVHLWLGSTIGMIWGAICMCFAGIILGVVIGYLNLDSIHPYSIPMTILGICYGAAFGGVIGLIAGGYVGLLAPPSRSPLPDGIVIGSTAAGMAMGSGLGIGLYFLLCLLVGGLIKVLPKRL